MGNSTPNGASIRRDSYYRAMFIAAAVWNVIAGVGVLMLLRDAKLRTMLGFPAGTDAIASQLLAGCLLVFGLGYYWVSRDLSRNREIVKMGVVGKVLVFVVFISHALTKEIPATLVIPSLVDVLFAALFLEFLLSRRSGSQYAEDKR